jgi:hypothetical protein
MFDGLTLRSKGDAKLPTKLGVAVDRLPGYGEGYAERGSGLPLPGWDGASEASAPVDGHRAVSQSGPQHPHLPNLPLAFPTVPPCACLCVFVRVCACVRVSPDAEIPILPSLQQRTCRRRARC